MGDRMRLVVRVGGLRTRSVMSEGRCSLGSGAAHHTQILCLEQGMVSGREMHFEIGSSVVATERECDQWLTELGMRCEMKKRRRMSIWIPQAHGGARHCLLRAAYNGPDGERLGERQLRRVH